MSWQVTLLCVSGLILWIAVAAILLCSLRSSLPRELIDWRDQVAMAMWPIAVPLCWIYDVWARRQRPER